MLEQRRFIIYKCDSRYSITECSDSGIKHVFITGGCVSGDKSVLLRLTQMKPKNVSIEKYIERNAGYMVFEDQRIKAG